jgi:trehalose 6-phosphate phosphatase
VTSAQLDPELRAALVAAARARHLLVASDYDGTLAPIVADPAAAVPHPGSVAALAMLVGLPGTSVAVVSGRSLHDLAELLPVPPGVRLVGSHGAEHDADFARDIDDGAVRLRTRILEAVRLLTDGVPGVLLETKPAAVAVHVRRASRPDATRVLAAVLAGPGRIPGVHVTEGKEVVELSVVATGKGEALDLLRQQAGASVTVFLGDDVTDERAFTRLAQPDVTVKIGPGETAARFRVADPDEATDLLVLLAAQRAAWLAGAGEPPPTP